MKKNETYEKLPYSSPAIDVISFHNRLAAMNLSTDLEDMEDVYL